MTSFRDKGWRVATEYGTCVWARHIAALLLMLMLQERYRRLAAQGLEALPVRARHAGSGGSDTRGAEGVTRGGSQLWAPPRDGGGMGAGTRSFPNPNPR